jgi:hypothetical protein
LDIDIRRGNCSLLNRQPEQATTKREQQAGAGKECDEASCLRVMHDAFHKRDQIEPLADDRSTALPWA